MCGIAAYYGVNAATYVYRLMLELQHRGQESAGIAYVTDKRIKSIVRSGYVISAINLDELNSISSLAAIGHVRYSTSGGYMDSEGAQPIVVGRGSKHISIAFNGNIINYREISREYLKRECVSDSEALAELIYLFTLELGDVVEAVKEIGNLVIGSYSLVVLTNDNELIVARDGNGFKPLAYSVEGKAFIVASETSAIEALGFSSPTEVRPGEILRYDGNSLELLTNAIKSNCFTPCIFEYIYFSRPDTIFNGIQIHEARVRMGMFLGKLDAQEVDIAIPVPDSGRSAALGYSIVRHVMLDEGLIRNRYVGRSFIMPPNIREFISSVKYGVVKSVVNGRRIAVVDDSLIRGTTIKEVVRLLKGRGAHQVHVRIASPPIRYPCFMGIDFPTRRELIAARLGSIESIAKAVEADSILYNTVEGLKWAAQIQTPCMACFTGEYPFKGLDLERLENAFSRWS